MAFSSAIPQNAGDGIHRKQLIAPGGEDGRVTVSEGKDGAAATLTSTTHDFVVWGTQRRPWRTLATVVGDEDYAGRVFDAVNII